MIFIGELLYGFCDGYFGRNSYENKRIEGIGADWVVAREENGTPSFATFDSTEEMLSRLKEWGVDRI